ncbi:MAG: TM2 domain-containing protein [Spirochaetia bacterium]|nr:TM2 domain-containing protein [Spirochaetia bacterium]
MDTELQTTQQVPATNAGSTKTGSSKSRLVAFLLCTFAGFVGAHNFYVGRTVRGIIQLVLMIGGFILYGVAIVTLATLSTKVDNGADVEIALIVGILLSLVPVLVGAIWIFIDWIMVLAGAFKDKNKRPLKNWSIND